MLPGSNVLQLAFIDGLFLCLVVGFCLWFRAWLTKQQQSIDQRLEALDRQQQLLTRLGERLQGVCRSLEGADAASARSQGGVPRRSASTGGHDSRGQARPTGATTRPDSRQPRTDSETSHSGRRLSTPSTGAGWQPHDPGADSTDEVYGQARDLLERGMAPSEVARRLGLGIAEVSALQRIQQSRQS